MNPTGGKESIYSHFSPSTAIHSLKSITNHLHSTRDLLHSSLDQLEKVKLGISSTSSNLTGTSSMYNDYEEKLKKSDIYAMQLKRREAWNARMIRWSFWALICVVVFVILRRLFFPDCYRWKS